MISVEQIYNAINAIAPFSTQEKWDNSGLLVGAKNMPANKIYLTLDISIDTISEAKELGADLIISHHPVIFSPLKSITPNDSVWQLIHSDMSAICVHTPLDIAKTGINARVYQILKLSLSLKGDYQFFDNTSDKIGIGWIDKTDKEWDEISLAEVLQKIFNVPVVRYSKGNKPISRIYFCSGSGSSMLEEVAEMGVDAVITGDVKHDRWYTARNLGISLFDCGHYYTEKIAVQILKEYLQDKFSEAEIFCSTKDNPVYYIMGDNNI
ncbi:MAG: Nif3-like dinuclear metal center hexameric protein [Ruminococcus sp.]|nr:Nif3-like dinuclear metal center hexameric protein [Ruminococcus sp.]